MQSLPSLKNIFVHNLPKFSLQIESFLVPWSFHPWPTSVSQFHLASILGHL